MTNLDSDPRTKSAAGLGILARLSLKPSGQHLLDDLGSAESVIKFVVVSRPAGVFAITASRAILVGNAGGRSALRSFDRPLSLTVIKKGFAGSKAILTGAGGASVEFVASDLDLVSLSVDHDLVSLPTDSKPGTFSTGKSTVPDSNSVELAHATGKWKWHKSPLTWKEAEELAADHMRHLGYQGVRVTPSRKDGGVDVVAEGAAAQVKLHAAPSGAPAIQALVGAALDFPSRLFYATAYTSDAVDVADARDVALFRMEPFGGVTAVNQCALSLTPPPPPSRRKWYEPEPIEDRVRRCLRWSEQISAYTATAKISNSDRRAKKQLQKREGAMIGVVQAMEKLALVNNPTFKEARRTRTVAEAEKLLQNAAKSLGLLLE